VNRHSGFTLIEIALALLIIGLLISSILVPLGSQVESRKYDETQKILDQARDALIGYAAVYGYFPCPADAASNGQEPAGTDHATGACPTWYGFLPAATLGFSPIDAQGYAIDAWGFPQNRLRYAVSNTTVNGIASPFTRTNGVRSAGPANIMNANLLYVCRSGSGVNPGTNCGTAFTLTSNAPVVISAPAGRGGTPAAAAAPAPPQTVSEKLGDGVYLITGGYAVIAIDFKDHITLIESGQSEERALAVIAEAKRLIPNKPITQVVNTHSHIDHSSGLRGFVAEGATILTYQSNKAYLQDVLSQPHTLNPDKAQMLGKKPVVEGVGDKRVLTDGTRTVELHRMTNFGHHDGMLLVYLPKEKVLLEADAYNPQAANATPPNPASPYTLSLLDNVQRLNLDVQRVIPVHYPADNRVITLDDVTKWVGRTPSTR
jgi:prepilin-type N-terminal cleavage/methylation domain-containing protein